MKFFKRDWRKLVGGAIVFLDNRNRSHMYIGRIFVNPSEFKKGYGIAIMEKIAISIHIISQKEVFFQFIFVLKKD